MATIKVKPWGKDQGDYVVIEEENFNAEFHERIDAPVKTTELSEADKARVAELLGKLDDLNADDVRWLAPRVGVKYTNKDGTVEAIKAAQGYKEVY